MKVALVIAICAWWTIFTLATSSLDQPLNLNPVTFDLQDADADSYSAFLNTLRNTLKDSAKVCNLLSLQKSITGYLRVDLTIGAGKTITLAIEAKNLYLRAYKNNNQATPRRLKDSDAASLKTFFGVETKDVGFGGSYIDLERAAKTNRANIQLGLIQLQSFAQTIYKNGASITSVDEAKFFIVAIQMVSEAARFKYIENFVKDTFTGVKPNGKVLDLEKNWDSISTAIFKSSKDKTKPCTSITGVVIDGKQITTVAAIAPDVGIMLYKTTTVQEEYYFITRTFMRSVVGDDGETLALMEPNVL